MTPSSLAFGQCPIYSLKTAHIMESGQGNKEPKPKGVNTKAGEQYKLSPEIWDQFFTKLGECGNVTEAAKGIDVSRVWLYRIKHIDPEITKRWEEAEKAGVKGLEDEAKRRAFIGIDAPQYYKGERIEVIKKYSDLLLIFLLKAHDPEKYRERIDQKVTTDTTITDEDLTGLTAAELKNFKTLLTKARKRAVVKGAEEEIKQPVEA